VTLVHAPRFTTIGTRHADGPARNLSDGRLATVATRDWMVKEVVMRLVIVRSSIVDAGVASAPRTTRPVVRQGQAAP
jgi:hypothetical protein